MFYFSLSVALSLSFSLLLSLLLDCSSSKRIDHKNSFVHSDSHRQSPHPSIDHPTHMSKWWCSMITFQDWCSSFFYIFLLLLSLLLLFSPLLLFIFFFALSSFLLLCVLVHASVVYCVHSSLADASCVYQPNTIRFLNNWVKLLCSCRYIHSHCLTKIEKKEKKILTKEIWI